MPSSQDPKKQTSCTHTKKATKATPYLTSKPETTTGNRQFTEQEVDILLTTLETHPPRNLANWPYIAAMYDLEWFKRGIEMKRDSASLQRKYHNVRPLMVLITCALLKTASDSTRKQVKAHW